MADDVIKIEANYKGICAGQTSDGSIKNVRMNNTNYRVLVENSPLSALLDSVGVYVWNNSSGTVEYLRNDGKTRAIQTIEYEHHEIHDGSSFTCDRMRDVGNGTTMAILLETPNTTKWFHMLYELDVELESTFRVYEDVTASGGTVMTIINRDRNNTSLSTGTASYLPSITSFGTIIRQRHFGSGKSFGGGTRGTSELILKQGKKYLFELTNDTTSNNFMTIVLDWYEHTNVA